VTALLSVIASAYLAIAFDAARRCATPDTVGAGAWAQVGAFGTVLTTGLAWPREYWALIRRDWDNHFLD
jgi:hypothetical protein